MYNYIYQYRRRDNEVAEEEKSVADIALKIKIEALKKFQQITLLVELYCDDKKVLKYLKKIVAKEEKRFKESRFSQTENTFAEIAKLLEATGAVIKGLLTADTVEEFNRAKRAMETHLYELEQELKPKFSNVTQEVKDAFEKTKEKVRSLKNVALEGLKKIKNDVCDVKDQDSESV